MHSKHLGKKLERIRGGNTHQHWRTPTSTSVGRRTTLPPPADEHHPPHTGLPPRSSSTGRTPTSSSDHWRSPRVAVGSGWRRNEKKRRRRGEERGEERRHVGKKREKLHFSPFLSTNHNQAPNFLQLSPYFLTTTPNNTEEPETKTTRDTQTPIHHKQQQQQQQGKIFKIINSNYIMEN